MKISEVITRLQHLRETIGDVSVVVGAFEDPLVIGDLSIEPYCDWDSDYQWVVNVDKR